MRVLSVNAGYFLGYETYIDHVRNPVKGVIGSRKEENHLGKFLSIVESSEPDFILVQEIDNGSLRSLTGSQHEYISENLPDGFHSAFSGKYRGTVFPRLPVFRYLGNSVFYREGEVKNHSLDTGRKNLVQEIVLDDISIFSVHLTTLGQRIRRKQLEEIESIAEQRPNYVIAGDFNCNGDLEMEKFENILDCEFNSPGCTFPAKKPKQKLDIVATSENVELDWCEVIQDSFSDHRPILFEMDLEYEFES